MQYPTMPPMRPLIAIAGQLQQQQRQQQQQHGVAVIAAAAPLDEFRLNLALLWHLFQTCLSLGRTMSSLSQVLFFWRAVVGRDRADMSLAGRHVFKMNAAAGTSDVELAAAHCGRVIQRLVDRRLCFYVGISRDPGRRWSHHANSSAWARMIIAVETPHASASSSVEVRTLQSWGEHSLCSNRSGGGETRIAGSPHFVYVLEGSGLMRR